MANIPNAAEVPRDVCDFIKANSADVSFTKLQDPRSLSPTGFLQLQPFAVEMVCIYMTGPLSLLEHSVLFNVSSLSIPFQRV